MTELIRKVSDRSEVKSQYYNTIYIIQIHHIYVQNSQTVRQLDKIVITIKDLDYEQIDREEPNRPMGRGQRLFDYFNWRQLTISLSWAPNLVPPPAQAGESATVNTMSSYHQLA